MMNWNDIGWSLHSRTEKKKLGFKSLLVLLISLLPLCAVSQTPRSFYWEPEFEVEVSTEGPWAYSFGTGKRSLLSEKEGDYHWSGFRTEHLQLEHFTFYQRKENLSFGLGVRYRFKEMFEEEENDELRFMQQVSLSHSNPSLAFTHKFRTEQRLRSVEVIHRFRYEFEVSKEISSIFAVEANTEALFSVSPQNKPALEQRFALNLVNSSFGNLELSAGLEYRLEDYNLDLGRELFFGTGAALEIMNGGNKQE